MSKSNKTEATNFQNSTEGTNILDREDVKTVAADKTKNVSIRIRELTNLGCSRGQVVKALTAAGYRTKNGTEIRFQHVRNVLITPVKKS